MKSDELPPLIRVFDPEAAHREALENVCLECGITFETVSRGELVSLPDSFVIILLQDRQDTLTDELVGDCLLSGHGVILFNERPELARVVELLTRGAAGYLAYPFGGDELRGALRVAEGATRERVRFFSLHASAVSLIERLSPREKQVFSLVTAGRTSRAISLALGISRRTVEGHRLNILRKLGVSLPAAQRLGLYAGMDRQLP